MCWNVRWLGTAHEAPSNTVKPKVPPTPRLESSRVHPKNLSTNPQEESKKRRNFILRRLASVAIICAMHALIESTIVKLNPFLPSDFVPAKQHYIRRLPDVTLRESLIRCFLVISFVLTNYAQVSGYHRILSVFFVAIGLDSPDDWPTLYGSPWQMYSVRRFWGRFWHRSTFRTYIGYGNLVAQKGCRLRRGTLAHKLCVEFTVFLVSGVIHALTTRTMGFRRGHWEDIAWFCGNFAAILVETVFQAVCGGFLGKLNPRLHRALGAMWLFAFFFWSVPKLQFPKVYYGVA